MQVGDVDLPLSAYAALRYLSAQLTRFTDIPSHRRFRSSVTDALFVRPTRLDTVDDRAFPVAAAKLWNELSGDLTASVSLTALISQSQYADDTQLYVTQRLECFIIALRLL